VSKGLAPNWDDLTAEVEKAAGIVGPRPETEGIRFPNENQLRLELAWRRLLGTEAEKAVPKDPNASPIGRRMLDIERDAELRWISILRTALYNTGTQSHDATQYVSQRTKADGLNKDSACPSGTLSALVEFLSEPRHRTQIERVITFNADDWLEFELSRRLGRSEFFKRFRIVTQPTFGPDTTIGGEDHSSDRRLPIIHAHGFLCHPHETKFGSYSDSPTNHARQPSYDAPNMLVFRDIDYWRMTANPMSFANHTLLNAMTNSRCIFIGLSFRDINLLRWTGVLAAEHEDAWQQRWNLHFTQGDDAVRHALSWARHRRGHRWIEQKVAVHIEDYFRHRGISLMEVEWGLTSGENALSEVLRNALK
jgi:hypothetical protein